MKIHTAEFISSYTDVEKCPRSDKPEVAFIGRSNVGKSSLINMLTGRKNLAKTSATPGKTQMINMFSVNNEWTLVDLPGYGFARVSKIKKQRWEGLIQDYLLKRPNLILTFVLVDIRHEPQENDIRFINWMGEQQVPFCIAFTKADKQSTGKNKAHIKRYQQRLLEYWEETPQYFLTSAHNNSGKIELLKYIQSVIVK